MRQRTIVPNVLVALLVAGTAVSAASCAGPPVDLAKALKVTDVVTGWYDAGILADGRNKLVPSISFRLKNAFDREIASVQLFAKFSRVGETEEWGTPPYIRAIGPEGLAPGASTQPIVLRSNLGYKGEQPRAVMLRNRSFVDARVELYAKYRSNNWAKLGEYQVARQLLTK